MEVDWNEPDVTKRWVDGYASVSNRYLYNFGDAGGCPRTGTTDRTGLCNNGWTQEDIRYISWKSPPAWPLPQIYTTDESQAEQ